MERGKWKAILLGVLCALCVETVHAQIAFDATANAQSAANASSLTFSHTVSGANRLLHVGVSYARGSGSGITVSGVTYAAVAMTSIRSDCNTGGATEPCTAIFYLIAPATGANNVVITMSAAVGSGRTIVGGAISLTGAHQTSPLDAHNGNNSFDVGISVSVTTVADNCWVVDTVAGLAAVTVGAGQTQRWNVTDATNQPAGSAGSTEGPKTPAGAVTMSWGGSDTRHAISAASYQPSTGAAAVARRRVVN